MESEVVWSGRESLSRGEGRTGGEDAKVVGSSKEGSDEDRPASTCGLKALPCLLLPFPTLLPSTSTLLPSLRLLFARAPLVAAARRAGRAMAEHLEGGLRDAGLWSPTMAAWLQQEQVTTEKDLAFCFRTAEKALLASPEIAEAWAWARARLPDCLDSALEARDLLQRLEDASRQAAGAMRAALRRAKPTRAKKPRPKAKHRQEADRDKSARRAAAEEAVRRSLEWRPRSGVGQGLKAGDPLIPEIVAITERRIMRFEARGVRDALKVLDQWLVYKVRLGRSGSEIEDEVLMTKFVEDQSAATGPLRVWTKLDWVKKHLKIEVPIQQVPKPAKKADESGAVKEESQAVAVPPEYAEAFEGCLQRMTQKKDWRRVALAAALEVAYSLVRVCHMNRSTFLSESPVTYWLDAFRGKGKQQGARRRFKWAMTRHGITGLDIGKIIFDVWEEWSKKRKIPLDFIVMDPDSGSRMDGSHVQSVIQAVAAGFLPDPKDQKLVRVYGFRRFGGTLARVAKTPAQDVVDFGGWAGVPELAQIVDETTEVLRAWKRSMPHLYADVRKENEEIQKLLHREILAGLVELGRDRHGPEWVASWEALQELCMSTCAEGSANTLSFIRCQSMDLVAKKRKDLIHAAAYGAVNQLRQQYTVKRVVRMGVRAKQPDTGAPQLEQPRPVPEPVKVAGTAELVVPSPALPDSEISGGPGRGRGRRPGRGEAAAAKRRRADALQKGEDELESASAARAGRPEPAAAADVWYFTSRMELIHKRRPGTEWIPACSQRQARGRVRAATDADILWSGLESEARRMGRKCCPAAECAWS